MNILISITLFFIYTTAASASWLLQTKSTQVLSAIKNCKPIVLNPHLGGDIYKVDCSPDLMMNGLSPLTDLQFEEESTWRISEAPPGLHDLNDPWINDQWALEAIQIDSHWSKQGLGSKDIKVAIIDTGIDYLHEDLAANVAINQNEIPDNNLDDDQNGYIDDVHGWNSYDENNNAIDFHQHGTHVSGIIGAQPHNKVGVAGLNWNVSLISIRFIGANGGGSTQSAIRAFDYAAARDARIVNASWGGAKDSPLLKEIIARCADKNILVIAAAGNEGVDNDQVPIYPANFDLDNIISVAAFNLHGELSHYSNWGKTKVHIAAPGESILNTIIGQKYGYMNGTSMAAPHISGAAALIWSKNPNWSYRQVREAILNGCTPTESMKDKIKCGGYFKF